MQLLLDFIFKFSKRKRRNVNERSEYRSKKDKIFTKARNKKIIGRWKERKHN
jgi:hypothetical protein